MSLSRPRILIAEDHIFLAELRKKLLDGEFDVVGIVTDGRAMVREASQLALTPKSLAFLRLERVAMRGSAESGHEELTGRLFISPSDTGGVVHSLFC